ncbi:MAG TPA: hypothetical protein VLN48_07050, partial [Bryobacteraceae bacterium]|nr:hypothetical protein [Bryobacteraceae bacterium]
GDRPFEIGHIDHTELDVEVVCSETGRPLGRPWMTILTDAFSRRCFALYLTFDAPSYRSCMMILRDCVRRGGRLPQIIVDGITVFFMNKYFPAVRQAIAEQHRRCALCTTARRREKLFLDVRNVAAELQGRGFYYYCVTKETFCCRIVLWVRIPRQAHRRNALRHTQMAWRKPQGTLIAIPH